MFISENNLAALLGTSIATVKSWASKGIYPSVTDDKSCRGFNMEDLKEIPEVKEMIFNHWEEEKQVTPLRDFTSVELFAGGGGMALGMELAGFKHILLNEFDTSACNTLRVNRPEWNVIEGDIRHIDFTPLRDKVDFLSGGFPCQAFSFAGKQGGFNDIRGTLFFEMARAVKEINPKVFLGENVKGLVSHDRGKTFRTICNIIGELGYNLVPPRVLRSLMYQVPQKRERIILIAIRKDVAEQVSFIWPSPFNRVLTLKDAFFKSVIFDSDVPTSEGASYPLGKQKVLSLVPPGGDWRDLPENIAKEYMGGSWYLGGGKTGMARRLSLDEPALTLTCSPAQKQTERCHPLETRPLTIREYARIQTFPDNWVFQGTMSDKYKQIGNAVPVNLAWAIGRSLIRLFNDIERKFPSGISNYTDAVNKIKKEQQSLIIIKDKKTQTSTIKKGVRQLNLFDLFCEFNNSPITENKFISDLGVRYGVYNDIKKLNLPSRNTLVGLVKRDCQFDFESRNAKLYFTGKKFPSTVNLKSVYYFMPYIKGKGIRDLYLIKNLKIDLYNKKKDSKNDFRLAFEIEYLGDLFSDYKKINLEIWHTYTDTNIENIKSLE